jgi:hypothetical protein
MRARPNGLGDRLFRGNRQRVRLILELRPATPADDQRVIYDRRTQHDRVGNEPGHDDLDHR